MNKTGLVLKVEKSRATLLTSTGEFVKVSLSKKHPKIGENYCGQVYKKLIYLRYLRAAASLLIVFLFGGGATYAYYAPVAKIQVIINPSIELLINRFDKIVKSSPLNADGATLLKNLHIKNKNIDEALTLVVEEAKNDNFINNNYKEQGKTILVKVEAKDSDKIINLDKFQQYISQNKINTKIDDNGKKTDQEFNKIDKNVNKEAPKNTKIKPVEIKPVEIKPIENKPLENNNTRINNNVKHKEVPKEDALKNKKSSNDKH